MTLQSNGQISVQNVNVELCYVSSSTRSLNDFYVRQLFGVASGTISLSNAYGKTRGAGSTSYNTPGTYSFSVPPYQTLTVYVYGAGGGGGGAAGHYTYGTGTGDTFQSFTTYYAGSSGGSGGSSSFGSSTPLIGGGGGGGGGAPAAYSGSGTTGAAATSSGGTTNSSTGGGAAGARGVGSDADGGLSAAGGYATKAFVSNIAGSPAIGANITVTVGTRGAGGAGGNGGTYNGPAGSPGGNGWVTISWA